MLVTNKTQITPVLSTSIQLEPKTLVAQNPENSVYYYFKLMDSNMNDLYFPTKEKVILNIIRQGNFSSIEFKDSEIDYDFNGFDPIMQIVYNFINEKNNEDDSKRFVLLLIVFGTLVFVIIFTMVCLVTIFGKRIREKMLACCCRKKSYYYLY